MNGKKNMITSNWEEKFDLLSYRLHTKRYKEVVKDFVRSLLHSQKLQIQNMIIARMNKYVNTPFRERKNAFDELAELNDDITKL